MIIAKLFSGELIMFICFILLSALTISLFTSVGRQLQTYTDRTVLT